MPTIRHPGVAGTAEIPPTAVPYWTGPGGWELVTSPAPRKRSRASRRRSAPAPQSTPAPDAGAPDDDPGLGSSTTEHTEE